ncbi:MAG: hypothetical protein Ct9H300mP24_8160 [Candidatus Neomarinimicrobiota bacterium]|nr:MAG: hypothetical protein Ct9H300mP24_8160 [Candidatus Neomarinimicrobiota bacterium]
MIGTEHVVSNRLLGIINELNKNQTKGKKKDQNYLFVILQENGKHCMQHA